MGMKEQPFDPRDHEAFVREIDPKVYDSAVTNLPRGVVPRRRGMTWRENLAAEMAAISGDPPIPVVTSDRTTCFFWAWPGSSSTARSGEHHLYVPVGSNGYYYGMVIGIRAKSTYSVPFPVQYALYKPGKHTKAASCTRVGSWTYISGATGALHGEYYHAVGDGATISYACVGSIAAAHLYPSSAGGYGVVSIDGSYAFASPLPTFTAGDYAAGLCRSQDVGRYYVNCYNPSQWSITEVLATGLTDAAHTVQIEVCGTKPVASSDYRVIVEALVGCSASDTVANASTHMVPVFILHEVASPNGSAYGPVQDWAPVGSTAYQWIGTTHADNVTTKEVSIFGPTIEVDGTDRSSPTLGTYYSGTSVSWYQESAASHQSDLNTNVLNRKRRITAQAKRQHPLMMDITHEWLVAGGMSKSYPLNFPVNRYDYMRRGMHPTIPDAMWLGAARLVASQYSANNNNLILLGEGQPETRHTNHVLAGQWLGQCFGWCSLVSASPRLGQALAGNGLYLLVDRSDGVEKAYSSDVYETRVPVAVGDKFRYVSGWGALPEVDFAA